MHYLISLFPCQYSKHNIDYGYYVGCKFAIKFATVSIVLSCLTVPVLTHCTTDKLQGSVVGHLFFSLTVNNLLYCNESSLMILFSLLSVKQKMNESFEKVTQRPKLALKSTGFCLNIRKT